MGEVESSVAASTMSVGFRRLYETHYPNILAYCTRRAGRNDAPDLVAEVFVVAWRSFSSIPADPNTLAWLYGVARRVVWRHWRSQERHRSMRTKLRRMPQRPAIAPDARLVQREEYELVLTALARLRPADQELLLLSVWEELSHSQVAVALGIKVPAVRQRFRRAKRALRREFDRVGGTLPPSAVGEKGGRQ